KAAETLVPQRFRNADPHHPAAYFHEPRLREMEAAAELFARRRDGGEFPAETSLSSVSLKGQDVTLAVVRDVSERSVGHREKELQRQLERARRLESVGQLAGGIAHDFNNILAVIVNYAEFVAGEVEVDSQAHRDVIEIRRAAERAASLTRQLLIYSRREIARPEVLYMREVVGDLENLLRRALGERIELQTRFGEERLPVEIDPGQFEQVLVNLAVNARDAMPEGGCLLIEIDRAELDEEYAYMHPGTEPGDYARLQVSDTGVGIDRDTLERVFEPFFTTKDEGTGLGLATVYGIVTGVGGRVDIYSEPDVGTSVKIHLPIARVDPEQARAEDGEAPRGHGEVVLVVEDEPEVKRMAERILDKGGFSVIGADRGSEALEICSDPSRRIDLLLTDVVMPDLLGTDLAERVREARPGLPVIYMSGYNHEVLAPETMLGNDYSAFLEKPFSSETLLRTIDGLLD
ncbi:MAG TPA: ATP-binding protein, partial [Solirubrobacterales bacterium]